MASEEGERKLAAILSADVVGYSKLMADDERATVNTLKEYRSAIARVIERHLGRVVNAPGDNILAEFRSAVEAVQSAHEIQHVLKGRNFELAPDRRMDFRIGVNLGDVIEEEDGTIYGDGVNIAARMEALADPGGICIASSIYEAVEGKLDFGFDYQGEHKVKNIDKPVNVYRVRADGGTDAPPTKASKPMASKIGIFTGAGVALGLAIGGVVAWLTLDRAGPVTMDDGASAPLPAAASGPTPADQYILVGNLVDFGGATSIIGRVYGQAKIDAANWINENGGINGRLIDFDTVEYSYLLPRAMAAYRKWQAQEVLAVQGWGTPDTMALVTHVAEDEVPYFSVSYAASITDPTGEGQGGAQAAPYNYFYSPSYSDGCRGLVQWAAEDWQARGNDGAPKYVHMGDNHPYPNAPKKACESYAEELGFEILPAIIFALLPEDFTRQCQRLRDANIDYAFLANTALSVARLLKDCHAVGVETQLMANIWGYDENVMKAVGVAADGVVWVMGAPKWDDEVPGMYTVREVSKMSDPTGCKYRAVHYMRGVCSMFYLKEAMEWADKNGGLTGPNIKLAMYQKTDWVPVGLEGVCSPATWTAEDHRGVNRVLIYRGHVNGRTTEAEVPELIETGVIALERVQSIDIPRRPEWLGW
jgi:class 3 adenylate cyclase/ABC-type branched-subunit amino acid transport system substrate-binding protein